MKKLIFKTILITFGITLVLAISVFGIVSVSAPYAMMRLTASLGLDVISGDYAYQEYERSGDIGCLARSFLIAAEHKSDRLAEERFEVLAENDKFPAFCEEQTDIVISGTDGAQLGRLTYADYLFGRAACVKYRLADAEEQSAAAAFAVEKTDRAFPEGNPAAAVAVEAASANDTAFCTVLLSAVRTADFEENTYYQTIIKILEACS